MFDWQKYISLKKIEEQVTFFAFISFLPISLLFKQGINFSIILLSIASLLTLYQKREWASPYPFVVLALFPFFGMGLSLLNVVDSSTFAASFKFISTIAISYFVYIRLQYTDEQLRGLVYGVGASIILLSIIPFVEPLQARMSIHSINNFSLFLSVTLCLFAYGYVRNLYDRRILLGVMIVSVIVVFSLSNNTAQYCIVLGALVWTAASLLPQRLIKVLAIISVVSLSMGMPWFIKHSMNLEQFSKQSFINKPSFYHRLLIWEFLSDKILKKPFKIRGFDSLRRKSLTAKECSWMRMKEKMPILKHLKVQNRLCAPHHPHNASLQMWHEFGVGGALLWTCFLIYMIFLIDGFPTSLGRTTGYTLFSIATTYFHVSYGLWESKWWLILVIVGGLFVRLEKRYLST